MGVKHKQSSAVFSKQLTRKLRDKLNKESQKEASLKETVLENSKLNSDREVDYSLFRPPTFSSLEDERQHLKQRLAAAYRLFAMHGFDEGLAGHITVRDPENKDQFWVAPWGVHFSKMRASDLHLIDHSGKVLLGNKPINDAAFAIHASIHKARPDLLAAAHAHSMYGRSFSVLGREIDPISQDSCAFYEQVAIYDEFGGVAMQDSEGERIAKALGDKRFAILRHHGLLTTGESLESCIWFFIAMEKACQSQLLVEGKLGYKPIPHKVACETRALVGSEIAGFASFNQLYQTLVSKGDMSFLE